MKALSPFLLAAIAAPVFASNPLHCASNCYSELKLSHQVYTGVKAKSFYDNFDNTATYSGISLGYNLIFNKYTYLNAEHSRGNDASLEIGDDQASAAADTADRYYISNQISLFVTNNTQQGWNINAGLGAFSEKVKVNDLGFPSFKAEGHMASLGTGYKWKHFNSNLTYSYYRSGGYNSSTFKLGAFGYKEIGNNINDVSPVESTMRSQSLSLNIGYQF